MSKNDDGIKTGWLVEIQGKHGPEWFTGGIGFTAHEAGRDYYVIWTSQSTRAAVFHTKEAADDCARRLRVCFYKFDTNIVVTDHAWVSP